MTNLQLPTIQISITPTHISEGLPRHCHKCPAALSVMDTFGPFIKENEGLEITVHNEGTVRIWIKETVIDKGRCYVETVDWFLFNPTDDTLRNFIKLVDDKNTDKEGIDPFAFGLRLVTYKQSVVDRFNGRFKEIIL